MYRRRRRNKSFTVYSVLAKSGEWKLRAFRRDDGTGDPIGIPKNLHMKFVANVGNCLDGADAIDAVVSREKLEVST